MQVQPTVPPTAEQTALQEIQVWEIRARKGINWFFWIGGLSLINTIIQLGGGTWTFIVGLGSSQFIDGVANALIQEYYPGYATILRLAAIAIDIGLAGIFVVAGLLGRKQYRWAVIIGMVLYFLDALLFIWFGDWLGIAFHALALFSLFAGVRAMSKVKQLSASQAAVIPTGAVAEDTGLFRGDWLRILGGSCAVYVGVLLILVLVGFILTR